MTRNEMLTRMRQAEKSLNNIQIDMSSYRDVQNDKNFSDQMNRIREVEKLQVDILISYLQLYREHL